MNIGDRCPKCRRGKLKFLSALNNSYRGFYCSECGTGFVDHGFDIAVEDWTWIKIANINEGEKH